MEEEILNRFFLIAGVAVDASLPNACMIIEQQAFSLDP